MSKVEVKQTGTSILGLLGIVFIVMKLAGIEPVANWSWWWVTAPFWGGWALVLGIVAVLFAGYGIVLGFAMAWDWFNAKQRKGWRNGHAKRSN